MEFARRFSHTSEMLQATTFKDARQPGGLHVDTSNNRSSKASQEPHRTPAPYPAPSWTAFGPVVHAPHGRAAPAPQPLGVPPSRQNNGTQDLPGPCAEYISNVKQMLARNDDQLSN
ncbi:hypothetical protein GQ600_26617 [Phytophthora cactorum]|nr:hypothetical protein GQ600_26617 [Phytophthora cactorum]